jgi:hypothetical protein
MAQIDEAARPSSTGEVRGEAAVDSDVCRQLLEDVEVRDLQAVVCRQVSEDVKR